MDQKKFVGCGSFQVNTSATSARLMENVASRVCQYEEAKMKQTRIIKTLRMQLYTSTNACLHFFQGCSLTEIKIINTITEQNSKMGNQMDEYLQ